MKTYFREDEFLFIKTYLLGDEWGQISLAPPCDIEHLELKASVVSSVSDFNSLFDWMFSIYHPQTLCVHTRSKFFLKVFVIFHEFSQA